MDITAEMEDYAERAYGLSAQSFLMALQSIESPGSSSNGVLATVTREDPQEDLALTLRAVDGLVMLEIGESSVDRQPLVLHEDEVDRNAWRMSALADAKRLAWL